MAAVVVLLGACQEAPQPVEPIAPAPSHAPGNKPGGRIAFTSDRDGNFEISVMNADGTRWTNVTLHPSNDTQPDWAR